MTFSHIEYIQKAELEKLQHINEELSKAWHQKNFLSVTYLNNQFHRTIYEAMGNTLLFSLTCNSNRRYR